MIVTFRNQQNTCLSSGGQTLAFGQSTTCSFNYLFFWRWTDASLQPKNCRQSWALYRVPFSAGMLRSQMLLFSRGAARWISAKSSCPSVDSATAGDICSWAFGGPCNGVGSKWGAVQVNLCDPSQPTQPSNETILQPDARFYLIKANMPQFLSLTGVCDGVNWFSYPHLWFW